MPLHVDRNALLELHFRHTYHSGFKLISGLSIIDEQISVTNASNNKRSQIMSACKQRLESPAPAAAAGPAPSGAAAVLAGLSAEQEALVERFMADSGMNAFWSKE